MTEHKYKQFDLMKDWGTMIRFHNPTIPKIHGIPWEVLDSMGWRWADTSTSTIFIPYFSASKQSIPFAQYRHLGGNVRFTMLKDAKPTCYGTWNLDNPKLFVVEGTSDAAVLEYAAVPWIAVPSAASKTLMQSLANYCKENGIQLVYAGDNDAAGDKLREALDEIMSYRVKQPPKYKDWGEFLEAEGVEAIQDYCFPELGSYASITSGVTPNHDLANVQKFFPNAQHVDLVGDPKESSKELSDGSPEPLY